MIKKIAGRWFVLGLVIFLAVFGFSLLLRNSFSYLDPDFGWHYKVGQEIWQNRQVPSIEHHLFPIIGQTWVDHEWLSNLLIFALNSWGGYLLVSFFFVTIIMLAWWLLAGSTIKYWLEEKSDSLIFWILLAIGLVAASPHFGVRVQEITVLFLLILNLWLARVVRRRRWRIWEIIALPLFFWFWACLHGGFAIGLVALATWTIFRLALYFLHNYRHRLISPPNILPFQTIASTGLIGLLSLAATCLTPYGLRLYGFLLDCQNNRAYLSLIQEWRPMTEAIWSWRMLYCLIFAVAIALLVFHWHGRQARDRQVRRWLWQQDWWQFLFSIILFVAAWLSLRHFPLFVIISLPWLASFYRQSWNDKNFRPNQWPVYLKWFLIIILILSTVAVIISTRWTNQPENSYCSGYPCAALEYLRQSPYRSWPALIDYGWGGYFYWQWTDKPIFIDGRMPQQRWRDRSLIEHYARFYDEADIKTALDDYNLAVIMIAQPQAVQFNWLQIWLLGWGRHVEDYDNSREVMRRAMLKLSNWRLAYSDATATIYVRQ